MMPSSFSDTRSDVVRAESITVVRHVDAVGGEGFWEAPGGDTREGT